MTCTQAFVCALVLAIGFCGGVIFALCCFPFGDEAIGVECKRWRDRAYKAERLLRAVKEASE